MSDLRDDLSAPPLPPTGDGLPDAPALSEWIGFKWLMGVQGRRVDVARLQADPGYRQACLDEAMAGTDIALRGYATSLWQRLLRGAG